MPSAGFGEDRESQREGGGPKRNKGKEAERKEKERRGEMEKRSQRKAEGRKGSEEGSCFPTPCHLGARPPRLSRWGRRTKEPARDLPTMPSWGFAAPDAPWSSHGLPIQGGFQSSLHNSGSTLYLKHKVNKCPGAVQGRSRLCVAGKPKQKQVLAA